MTKLMLSDLAESSRAFALMEELGQKKYGENSIVCPTSFSECRGKPPCSCWIHQLLGYMQDIGRMGKPTEREFYDWEKNPNRVIHFVEGARDYDDGGTHPTFGTAACGGRGALTSDYSNVTCPVCRDGLRNGHLSGYDESMEEVREHRFCSRCSKRITHTKLPLFWTVSAQQHVIRSDVMNDLEVVLLPGDVKPVKGISPGTEMTEVISKHELTLCAFCSVQFQEFLDRSGVR